VLELHKVNEDHYALLREVDGNEIRTRLRALAALKAGKSFELDALTDTGILKSLIRPFFRSNRDATRVLHLVDVGACFGQMSTPLLEDGWTADLFEPDPSSRSKLDRNMARFGSRCRIHAAAVTNVPGDRVSFHQAATNGLSGLAGSPFASTHAVLDVENTSLTRFLSSGDSKTPDFLKIDAEGYDFDVLDSNDFTKFRPRLILVKYGTHFPRQTLGMINGAIDAMATKGYGSIVFDYDDHGNFARGQWSYRLINLFIDTQIPETRATSFGNIIFYLHDDREFLLSLYSLIDQVRANA
jgi:FkbM family methyltransferase